MWAATSVITLGLHKSNMVLVLGMIFFRKNKEPEGRVHTSTQQSYTLPNPNLHNYYPQTEDLIMWSFGPLGYYPEPRLENHSPKVRTAPLTSDTPSSKTPKIRSLNPII